MYYRPEVDGLRAVAVLPVILFHAGFSAFGGGFVGVDVFFVISGYLITAILLKDLSTGNFSIAQFYERRARRILPALFFVLICTVPLAAILMTPPMFKEFAQSAFAVAFFASNVFFSWESGGYFAHDTELLPLLHTWSLAVEEQFYIVFPLLLAAIWKFGRQRLFWILFGLALLSLALCEWGWRHAPNMAFYLAPFRAWELLAGALCALYLSERRLPASNAGAALGLGLLLASVFLFDPEMPFPSLYTLLPVLGTALIVLCAGPKTWVGSALSIKPVVWIGLLSYSAYLWHQPLFAFTRMSWITEPPVLVMLSLCLAAFALAYVSWRFIEQPFRVSGFRPSAKPFLPQRRAVFAASLAGLVTLAGVGLYGHMRDGLPERFQTASFVERGEFTLARSTNGYCFYSLAEFARLEVGDGGLNCVIGATENPEHRALLFGDSFAGQWEPFWDVVGQDYGLSVHSVTTNWCYPSGQRENFTGPQNSRSHAQCRINRDFLSANASKYDMIILAGDWSSVVEQEFDTEPLALLDTLLASTEAEIIIMASPTAFYGRSVEQAVFRSAPERLLLNEQQESQMDVLHTAFMRVAAEEPRVSFLTQTKLFGTDTAVSEDGLPYSLDGSHISVYGALAAAEGFLERGGHLQMSMLLSQLSY